MKGGAQDKKSDEDLVAISLDDEAQDPANPRKTTVYLPQATAKNLTEKSKLLPKTTQEEEQDEGCYRRCWNWFSK